MAHARVFDYTLGRPRASEPTVSFLFPSSTITLDAALRDAVSGNSRARLRAVVALGQVEEPTERRRAALALADALTDDDPAVRAEAAAGLGQMGDLAPVSALVARLADGDAAVRQHAVIALGSLRERAAFAPLVEALREGPPEVRFQAVTSLAEIDPVAAYEPVAAALADRDPQVVAAAAIALGVLGDGRAVAALAPLCAHPQPAVRFEVAWALAQLGDARGRDELAAALGLGAAGAGAEAHPGRALEAVESLARLGTAEDARLLVEVVRSLRAQPEARIVAARHALTLVGEAPERAAERELCRAHLLAQLASRKDPLRGLAVEQLVAVGGAWAEPALAALAASRRGRALAEPLAEALAAISARRAAPAGAPPAVARDEERTP